MDPWQCVYLWADGALTRCANLAYPQASYSPFRLLVPLEEVDLSLIHISRALFRTVSAAGVKNFTLWGIITETASAPPCPMAWAVATHCKMLYDRGMVRRILSYLKETGYSL